MRKLQKIAQISLFVDLILLALTIIPATIFTMCGNKDYDKIFGIIIFVLSMYIVLIFVCAMINLIYFLQKEEI